MQIIFKAITGSSGYAFWWERTALHSIETVVSRLFDACLVALESISPRQRFTTIRYSAVHYLAGRTSQGSDYLRGFCNRFVSRPYSAALSFPPRGVTGTSCYCFEYNLHLIKISSHLNRESIYIELCHVD